MQFELKIVEISRFLLTLLLACLATTGTWAQDDDIDSGFKRLGAEEATQLRSVLAKPVPTDALPAALGTYFRAKEIAAHRLGDLREREVILRQWAHALPLDTLPRTNLSGLLREQERYEEAIAMRREAIALSISPTVKAIFQVRLANDLYSAGRNDEAQKALDEAEQNINTVAKSRNWQMQAQLNLSRARYEANRTRSLLHSRFGRWEAAMLAAAKAEVDARESLKLAQSLSSNESGDSERFHAGNDLAVAIAQKTQSLRESGRLGEAENSLQAYLRLSREVQLSPAYLSGIYSVAANLRFSQREFVQAEAYARKSDKVLDTLGYDSLHPSKTARAQTLIIALEGQKRWLEASAEFDRLDALAANDATLKRRVLFPSERALAYLQTGKTDQAANLYASVADINIKRYGADHFFAMQSLGLQGVALWRSGGLEKARALPLLKTSVRGYMAPANADYLENIGYRKELRELVFATYLEALATTPGEDATQALGPADWVRGGLVQEALADAAVRAATTDSALANLVRSEQDAKNEIAGLRKYLAGEAGGAASPLPEVAGKIRSRITELEGIRQTLQVQLKARFPDYERLVRPQSPSTPDIAKALDADEALVMLLPTDDAVYVWVVSNDKPAAFARVAMTQSQVRLLVRSARSTLDFAEMGRSVKPFNAAAASTLYQRLLQPVEQAFAGKRRLVIAAGGALSQLPFGVLLTKPSTTTGADSPWLIRQAAITQVPSVSAWLTGKQFAKTKPANELLLAWGDPQFAASTNAANNNSGQLTRQVLLTRASAAADLEKEDAKATLLYSDIPPLPETRDELLAIAATLKADPNRDLRLGVQATRASVLQSSQSGELQKKKVLVFATHGLMAGDLPNLSQPALAMAGVGNEAQDPLGALLTLADVLSLKLNADWVVLSACNTATADGKAEEALSGLARGFFYAGTRSLLVTHWAVENDSAKQLTTATFAHYMQNPQAPKAESLRQAMLTLMAQPKFAHPAYWAPYALVGDGGR